MTARLKRLIARILAGALLFAQLAVAAYACPQLTPQLPPAMQDMPGCEQMAQEADAGPDAGLDAGNPMLCLEHCRQGQQTGSHAEVPALPPPALVGLVVLPPLSRQLAAGESAASGERIAPAASPPFSILHCCFRI